MNEKRNGSQRPTGGLTLNDIYHVLFRHKWKILVLSSLGFIAAGVIYVVRPATYQSHAKILVKSVRENSAQVLSTEGKNQDTTGGPDGLIISEEAILSSFDVCLMVASNVTPAKILGKNGAPDAYLAAANMVHDNLVVERVGKSGGVISLVFTHHDPSMVKDILKAVIDAYKDQHAKIHVPPGAAWETLNTQTSAIHTDLIQVEEQLQKAKADAGVIDTEGTRKSNEAQIAQLNSAIMTAGAELAEHKAMLFKLQDAFKATTQVSLASTNTNAVAEIPGELLDRYRDVSELVNSLSSAYAQLRVIYAAQNPLVVEKKTQLEAQRQLKKKLENEEPRLAKMGFVPAPTAGGQAASPAIDPFLAEESRVIALESKIKMMQTNLMEVHSSATQLETQIPNIKDLERKLTTLEDKWKSNLMQLQNAKLDAEIGSILKVPNIANAEDPTPATRERSKTPKMMGVAVAVGIFLGLLWAFMVELYLDSTVKRPKEIEGELGMRLFLSIPDMNRNGHRRLTFGRSKEASPEKEHADGETALPAVNGNGNGNGKLEIAPWDANHSLHDYYEALRDRLISYFDINNLNHKPKLVAVSGPARGVGTTTIAAGLAASLSETGDGNVLLVDMNMENGTSQEFYKGKPGCELDAALGNETRDSAMIQDNLYVVSGTSNGDKLSRMLPKRFANLMPKLRASDYDYIIFDMPPLSRTGVTQRLAGFMDMMLLVVEAEKTNREVVRQAGALLNESKANVSVVLNKTRNYIPARLHQEF